MSALSQVKAEEKGGGKMESNTLQKQSSVHEGSCPGMVDGSHSWGC